ncbi:MAG: hypothetical protein LBV39_00630 [Bacteroidales bacterium]|nr:hypothetical protein [Bacteroidales bacterium]
MSFFPHLVAGPIVRANKFLAQTAAPCDPAAIKLGSCVLLILGGLFKKVIVANYLSTDFVDGVFRTPTAYSSLDLLFAMYAYAIQIYCDFSAYTDIAIGVAGLLGYEFPQNFNFPYRAASPQDFWRRWHMSLSSWLRDYLYIPLGGSRKGKFRTPINVLIVFAVSGLWHGASWNFVIWGTLNALFLICLDPLLSALSTKGGISRVLKSIFIWGCWALSLIFFRAQGFQAALDGFSHLGFSHKNQITSFGLNATELKLTFFLIGVLLVKEIIWEWKDLWLQNRFFKLPAMLRWAFYIVFVLSMVYLGQYGNGNENSFIYFQF